MGSHDNGHEEQHKGEGHQNHHAMMVADFRRRFWVSIVITAPILVLAPLIQRLLGVEAALDFTGDQYIQFTLATAVFFYGGWPFLTGAVDELSEKNPGMMTLIGLAIVVAYGYSSAVVFGVPGKVFFWELATLIDVMLLGHWIEMRSVMGASSALEELVKLMPSTAHRYTESGDVEDVAASDLRAGDRVLIKPGERVPADGVIVEGHTSADESMLTGESTPVEKKKDDKLIGGSVNGESSVTIEVEKTGEETYLSQVVSMVENAQESRSRSQNTAERAAFWLTIVALSVGAATLAAWLAGGREFVFALERMVTVMVITCPHALGLAVPLVVAVSTALGARSGLLIRERSAFERARLLNVVVFDKTGTLTEGRFGVTDVVPLNGLAENDVLRMAASLESHSGHPLAQGIVREGESRGLEFAAPEDFEAMSGQGVSGQLEGARYLAVGPNYLREHGVAVDNGKLEALAGEGKSLVYLLKEDSVQGAVALADVVREESREAVSSLREMSVSVMMLTGDNRKVAESVAKDLDLDDFFAEVLPDEKASKIAEIRKQGRVTAMVGDGVNDAPALVEADVGVAIGAGTDVALEAADVVLVRSDPRDVVSIVKLARETHRKMVQNLWWAAGYNIVAIPLAAGVLYPLGFLLPPAAGALVMSLSTVIVAINAKMLPESAVARRAA